jgi:hypothetical protein
LSSLGLSEQGTIVRLRRTLISAAGAALLLAGTPAVAAVSPHCQQSPYCLFSGTSFSGTKVPVNYTGVSCKTVASLSITEARSAVRGPGDSLAMELYSDAACASKVGTSSTTSRTPRPNPTDWS